MPKKIFINKNNKNTYNQNIQIKTTAKWLIIVESPSKCSKIESFLGPEYQCIASKGHICKIDGLSSINLLDSCKTEYSLIPEKKDHVDSMKKIVSKFPKQFIILATDDDREGEGIAWHLCIILELDHLVTKRVIFREITKPAIIAAIGNTTIINQPLVNAYFCRQILDMIVGYKISPILWKHIYRNSENALSAGRCQTPALRLVYDKDRESIEKTTTLVYKTVGSFFSQEILFDLNKSIEKNEEMVDFLSKSVEFNYSLSLDKKISKTSSSPKPFNTSNLLQRVSSQLHYSPKDTMALCQQLYQEGHITYMRTDSMCYSESFLTDVSEYIITGYCKDYVGDFSKIVNTGSLDTNPHEAIRVTHIETETISSGSNDSQRLSTLYKLIWQNTLESCMSDYKYTLQKVVITAPLKYEYSYNIETPIFLGWKTIKNCKKDKQTEIQEKTSSLEFYLQNLSKTNFTYNFIKSTVSIRGSERHYTEATLIKALEDRGIGRPSTFASIVDTIQDRGYVKKMDIEGEKYKITEFILRGGELEEEEFEKTFGKETNKLVLQNIGSLVIEFLITNFPELFSYDYTKSLELELDEIATRKREPWFKTCILCSETIDKQLSSMTVQKQQYRIDDRHVVVYERYGPVIKVVETEPIDKTNKKDKKPEYISIKKELNLDIRRLSTGGYSLEELIERKERIIGKYKESEVILKSGKFGYYIEWIEDPHNINSKINKKSVDDILKKIKKDPENLSISDIEELFNKSDSVKEEKSEKNIIRIINKSLSIRKGKFGAYIYYKTSEMVKPSFYNLKGFRGYTTCSDEVLLEWIKKTHDI